MLMTTADELDNAVRPLASRLSMLVTQLESARQRGDAEFAEQASGLASELEAFRQELLADLEPANAFMRLRSPTAEMTAVDAMDEVLGVLESLTQDALFTFMSETWTARKDELKNILAGAAAAADEIVGQDAIGLLDEFTDSLDKAETVLQDVRSQTLVLLERLRSDDAINVPLPPPPASRLGASRVGWGPGSTFKLSPGEESRANASSLPTSSSRARTYCSSGPMSS